MKTLPNFPMAALQMDRLWRLFPVVPQPRFASAKTPIQDATADPIQSEAWTAEFPGCNWGQATGAACGVFVLEADTRRASSILRVLCNDDWSWRHTLLMNSGNRGFAFFRWPASRAMRSSATLGPGVKIHAGEGDWVLVPPSSAHAYLDLEATIAPPPQWLIDSAFAGVDDQSSGKILTFPKMTPQQASNATPPSGLSGAKLLPFVTQVCPPDPRHGVHVFMAFQFHHGGWQIQFWEHDLQTQLPRTLKLATAEELIALAGRAGGLPNVERRQALDLAIGTRQGGIFLSLTTDQYRQLQKALPPSGRTRCGVKSSRG